MPGPAPKISRRRRNKPELGEWMDRGEGWQYGDVPELPDGLMPATVKAWQTWFGSWFSAHWTPDDVPGLLLVIRMYDDVARGSQTKAADRASLHSWMRSYGITPDGQQKLRWFRPKADEVPSSQPQQPRESGGHYAHLKVVNE